MSTSASRQADWRVVLGILFFGQLASATAFALIFPFLPLYIKTLPSTLHISVEMMAGLVIASTGFSMMLASPFWGAIADRYGRKLMLMRAYLGGMVIMSLMAFVQTGEQLLILRFIQGAITGTVAANNALMASVAPRERMGFAMGMLQVSLWGGIALGPLLGGVMADALGFAAPFLLTGALLGVGAALIGWGIHENFTPVKTAKRKGMVAQWKHVLGAEGVPMVYAMRLLSGLGRNMLPPIAPLFVVALLPAGTDHTSSYAGLAASVASATATFSSIALGRLGDSIGHRRILIACGVVGALCYVPQAFVSDFWQFLGLQAVAGVALGGILSAISALLAAYTQPGEEGAVYGLDNAIVSGSQAIAPLTGSVIATCFGMRGTFAATGLMLLMVGIAAYALLPRPKRAYAVQLAAGD